MAGLGPPRLTLEPSPVHRAWYGASDGSQAVPVPRRVQLLYFDGCPNWRLMEARLGVLAAELGFDVEQVLVESEEDAERWAFHGSPSVLIDGRDPFAPAGAAVGLACRIYSTPSGVHGSPTLEQLRAAIQ